MVLNALLVYIISFSFWNSNEKMGVHEIMSRRNSVE